VNTPLPVPRDTVAVYLSAVRWSSRLARLSASAA